MTMLFWNFYRSFILSLLVSNIQHLSVSCSIKTTSFYGHSFLNGKICDDSQIILQVPTASKIDCAQICGDNSTCTCVFYNQMTKTCTLCRGEEYLGQQVGTICYVKGMPIDGKEFKIYAKENNEFWHYNGAGSQLVVTSLAQPDDAFVRFIFEKQLDGSYKIKSVARPSMYMFDGYNVVGSTYQSLHGKDNSNDEHMRYMVTMVTDGYVTIQTKATGRYVRLDEDKYVTSKLDQLDERSLFKLRET